MRGGKVQRHCWCLFHADKARWPQLAEAINNGKNSVPPFKGSLNPDQIHEAVGVPMSKSMSTFKLMPNSRHGNIFTISANATAYAATTRLTTDLLTSIRRRGLAQPLP
jgi:hypothetical protein